MGIFDEFYDKPQEGMKDIGVGEPTGKDSIARRNIVALNERLNVESEKLSEVYMKTTELENTISMLQTTMANMEQANNQLRAELYQKI